MIRVLQIVPSLSCCGGVENYLMNYYRNIPKDNIEFDFCYHIDSDVNFVDEINSLGGKVFKLPRFSLRKILAIESKIGDIIKKGKYDIVHCHMANAAWLYFKVAKKYGVKVRIIHSHQAAAADKITHKIRNYPLLRLGCKRASHFFACSNLAGNYLFKNKKFIVINNAIDINKYKYDEFARNSIRKKLSIPNDTYVIGNIGRFCNQKNQLFLIDIFKKINDQNPNTRLLLIGEGELEEKIKTKVENFGIKENVIFTGAVKDTYKYYSTMDVFVLPSLYEGLPVVGVEAQINGLKVITSTTVTKELNFSGNVSFISLEDDLIIWAKEIIKFICISRQNVNTQIYDINSQSKRLEKIYMDLIGNDKNEN